MKNAASGRTKMDSPALYEELEVQGEEMVQLAKSGFGTPIRKRDPHTERVKPSELMTASALVSSKNASGQKGKARVLIDSVSENSYISESVTSILKATPLREETVIHSLFGGNETKPKHHSVFSIEKNSLVNVDLYHIHHIWHYRVRLRESGEPIGRLRKTCKNAFPRTIPVSFGRLDTPIATESSLNVHIF
ncbi:uncharacterized protein TNCV_2905091 [Trichonephila clavipes]|nr:uncharacterized protein TNCV_2905091 [Trichonephila clavipes]